ncbi:hypothetical protein [Nonlabens ponticola]|uniref:Uncharacterized protein n=1 Tax=Nonlabens ponticola TaxID=2496866 RepID=A0A3S9MY88_9FLAO|nr:hypothetical protein [Nonlabens ponticola]AZQ44013.1 hypothetical protein EJ995_07115 [Nonlabens ponticola]
MKKPLRILITLLIFLIACESYAQEFNKVYYGIASDSINRDHYLEFKNDSVVELISIHVHMQPQLRIKLTYSNNEGNILIESDQETKQDANQIKQYGFNPFLNEIHIEKDGKALLNKVDGIVYVIYDDFKNKSYTTYIIDSIKYRQENAIANSYGLLERKPKRNRKLKRKLKKIKSDLYNYQIEVYKGIDAYLKYGYDNVFGVIELKRT